MAASEGWNPVYSKELEERNTRTDLADAHAQTQLTALVQQHAALLFRIAFSVVRNRAEAEDIVQDTFLRVLERAHQLAVINDLRVWLVRLTWNRAIDHRRRRRPEQIDDALADQLLARTLPADQLLRDHQQLTTVLRELERLPDKERAVLLLSAVDELNTAEIAHILNRTESATRSLLHRARTRLRDRLNQGGSW